MYYTVSIFYYVSVIVVSTMQLVSIILFFKKQGTFLIFHWTKLLLQYFIAESFMYYLILVVENLLKNREPFT